MSRVAYLGNFGPSHSTENHVALSLESLGHEVTRIQEGETRALEVPERAADHDVLLWTQTFGLAESGGTNDDRYRMLNALGGLGITSVAFHLDRWVGLDREDQLADEAFFRCDHVFTADGGNDDVFARHGIRHAWAPPAVYHAEAVPGRFRARFASDVAFVGSWRGHYHRESAHRHEMIAHLRRKWGRRLRLWPRGAAIRGEDLRDLYASAKVVVGDSCLAGRARRYLSDRIPETLGRGGYLVHPRIEGVTDGTLYDEDLHLGCFDPHDWRGMDAEIERALDDPEHRRRVAEAGRAHVLERHTYAVRMAEALAVAAPEAVPA